MSKGRDFRRPRRRGFDDDFFSPPEPQTGYPRRPFSGQRAEPPAAEGPPVDATVKWFNPEKGFGFVEVADGSGDAFLHVATLQAAGLASVEEGSTLRIHVGQGQKGRQVTAVLEVKSRGTATPRPRNPDRGAPTGRNRSDGATAIEVNGTVKWFNSAKGFGFVVAEDGGKDVFVHISVLERAGLRGLADGQRVSMRVEQTQKGREAVSITPTPAP